MDTIDLLISARWILPIAPQNRLLEKHAVAIHQGRIVSVLPLQDAQEQFYAENYLEFPNHVLMPGLVNAHAHTPMNLFRGLADDLMLMDWLNNYIWPAEKALINPESVAIGSRLAIAEMLRGGITCFNDHYFFPDVTAQEAMAAGIRASLGCVIMSVPTEWAQTEKEYFAKAERTLKNSDKHALISWCLAPHAPYTVSDQSLKKVRSLAESLNLPIHMHVQETKAEVDQSLAEFKMRPLERLDKLGLLSPKFINVHMTQLTDAEIKLVKDTGSHIVHCPESNLKLASGFAPIAKCLNAGINVAIGTDGAASNNDLDLFGEMRTAAFLGKAVSENPTALPAEEVLKMATLNGAKALGLDHEIGSIEPGKAADLITVDLSHYITQPIFNPMSHLVYAVSRLQVSDVWVAGQRLVKNSALTRLDLTKLLTELKPLIEKTAAFQMKNKKQPTAALN